MTDESSVRSGSLQPATVHNPSLAEQLEQLLGEHTAPSFGEGFLENRVHRLPGNSGLSGQTLGTYYQLISQIGQGGMGKRLAGRKK